MPTKQETSPVDSNERCPDCGLLYVRGSARDERIHRGEHDKTVNGPKIRLEDGIHFIDQYSTKARCLAAAAAASIARWENRYDFSPYDGYEQPSAFETLVLIRVHSRRVIGLVVLAKTTVLSFGSYGFFLGRWTRGLLASYPKGGTANAKANC
jgi:hypothetical protein